MHRAALWTALLLAAVIFVLEVRLGQFAVWEPYLLPLVVAYRWGERRDIALVAVVCTALVAVSFLLDPSGAPQPWEALVHLVQIGVICLVAFLLAGRAATEEQRVRAQAALAEQVRVRTADLAREMEERRRAHADAVDAAQRLLRAEDRFARLFHASPAGSALIRRDGLILEVNEAYGRMTGYAAEQLIGQQSVALGIITEKQRAELLAHYDAHGSVRGVDMEIRHRDGKTVHVLYAIEAIEMQGEPCFLVLVVDIGLRKQMELQLRQLNGELEARVAQRTAALQAALADVQQAAKMKDQFMAMVSHELRTPLMGVLSLAEVLGTQRVGALNEKQLGYVRSIERSGQRLHALVNSILSYADLLAGNVQLRIESCSVCDLLRAAAAAIRPQAEAKGQTVTLEEGHEAAHPEGLIIATDGGALRQVLDRLLENAVKFTPEGGRIGVEARLVVGGAHVQIAVWDTGIGMDRERLDEAVKPFTQMGATLTRSHEGVGLGLAYVHQMLILLQGQLTLESAPEQGSRFVITLPQCWERDRS